MKSFLKLTNFEFNRFAKILSVILIAVFAIQTIGTIYLSSDYMNRINELIYQDGFSSDQAMGMIGTFSFFAVTNSGFFYGPIFIGIATVLFYIFLIWYRDWFGKNTFIYRLLMLPTERINVYLAKLVTILMITLSFIAIQLISLVIDLRIMKLIVSDTYREDFSVREVLMNNLDTGILFPGTFTEFFLFYGAGITTVAILFTAIMFERSYRLKGIVLGSVYSIIAVVIFFAPVLLNDLLLNGFFYSDEIVYLTITTGTLTLFLSIMTSAYLLRKKIRV
ncbi:hypothetical protein ACLIA0_08850 [Bacillaceae bacterium W0354]